MLLVLDPLSTFVHNRGRRCRGSYFGWTTLHVVLSSSLRSCLSHSPQSVFTRPDVESRETAHFPSNFPSSLDMHTAPLLWLEHALPPESCSSSSPGLPAVRGSEGAAGEWSIGDCANDHCGAMTRPLRNMHNVHHVLSYNVLYG